MKKISTKKIVFCALFTALTYVATAFLKVPAPITGYVHLGDGFVLLAGCLLGPVFGAFSAGVGSALADLAGFAVYSPATLVIKALMAVTAYFLFTFFTKKVKMPIIPSVILFAVVAELIMLVGYFVYDCAIYTPAVAIANLVWNLVQGAGGIIISSLLISVVYSNKRLKEMLFFD